MKNKIMGYTMKKLLIGILVFSFNVSAFANEYNGFRKIKWEESISKYKNVMRLTSADEKSKKFYVREDEDMSFSDDIMLTSIVYVFYEGKFSSVVLQTDQSATNIKQVLIELKKKYGEPSYTNKYINKYRWKNMTTTINLKCYSSSHKCSINYNSIAMNNPKKTDNVGPR